MCDGIDTVFRQQQMSADCVTAGWTYNIEEGCRNRGDLDVFLSQVFPIAAERDSALAYLAHMMSGRRLQKKLLVLTEMRSGDTGISYFVELLMMFFGSMSTKDSKYVCKSFRASQSYIKRFQSSRLLVADDLDRRMTLDQSKLKCCTGGGLHEVEMSQGRPVTPLKFLWQAGFLLIFDEFNTPIIDATDQAFMGRLISVPLRSQFMARVSEIHDPNTFMKDSAIMSKLSTWLSSLADTLVAYHERPPYSRL